MQSHENNDPWPGWWAAPPERMFGATVPIGAIVRAVAVAVHLPHVIAYPSGVAIPLRLVVRRRSFGDAQWDAIGALIPRIHWDEEPRRRIPASPGRPRFTVRGADGFEASTLLGGDEDSDEDPAAADEPPESPVLIPTETEVSLGQTEITTELMLWLVPLSPADVLTIRIEWPDADCDVTLELDGVPVRAAAASAQPIWDEPEH